MAVTFMLWVILSISPGYALPTNKKAADQNIVVVEGKLSKMRVFGPPKFGEDPKVDSRVTLYSLEFDHPIKSSALKLFDSTGVIKDSYKNIQIFCDTNFDRCTRFLDTHNNKRIIVSGIPEFAAEAVDYLPITMTALALQEK